MKKYELTGETKQIFGSITLQRIRAVIDFGHIKAGDIGGWIEKEENLSQYGKSWICSSAEVYGDAKVYGNAKVCDSAVVCGNVKVCGNARVCGNAKVYGNARVCDSAVVCDDAEVFSANHVLVIGPIGSRTDFTTFFRNKDNDIDVKCGCFLDKIDKFLEKVTETHGDGRYALIYRAAAEIAKLQIDLTNKADGKRL